MGQYYRVYVKTKEKEIVESPTSYDSGLKLMEHSWVGNFFVNSIFEFIKDNPSNIAWVGDYASDLREDEYVNKDLSFEKQTEIIGKTYPEKFEYKRNIEKVKKIIKDGYLINHTKKVFLDLEKYIKENDDKGWCINPLPLLTAIGNGMGGGDYRGINFTTVGIWAGDELMYSVSIPKECNEYKEVEYSFKE